MAIVLLVLTTTSIWACAPSGEDVARDSAVATLGTRTDASAPEVDTVGRGTDRSQAAGTRAQTTLHVARPGEGVAPGRSHAGPPHDTAAAQHVTWTPGQVDTVLRRLELNPSRETALVRQPFLSVPGTVYRVPDGEVQTYIYGDQTTRARDTDRLDPVKVSPPTMMVSWRLPPTLIVDNNLAVIVLTRDARLRQRLRDALGPRAHE